MEREPGALLIRTFPTALYICARGYRPIGARLSEDGVEVVFVFAKEARAVMGEYQREREMLSRVQSEVRRTGTMKHQEISNVHTPKDR